VFRIEFKSKKASDQSQDGCPDSAACFDGSGEHNETDEYKAKGKIFLCLTGSAKYPVGGMSSTRQTMIQFAVFVFTHLFHSASLFPSISHLP
jgi:hypothetical protein